MVKTNKNAAQKRKIGPPCAIENKKMSQKIFLKSAKGGAGATTVAAGLGFALSSAGERTLIVDGDSDSACALNVCGCADLQVFTVADYKKGACRAKQATLQHPKYKNLYIMPTLGCDDGSAVEAAVREVEGLFDYILCDNAALKACNCSIAVTEPYQPSVRAADVIISRLKDTSSFSGVIVNKVNGGLILSGNIAYPEDIARSLNANLIAVLPEDLDLTIGIWRPYSMKYFKLAAAALEGKKVKIPYLENLYAGAGGYFRRKLREKI